MTDKIIEIVELGQPQSLIQRENAPITELIKTDLLIQELNEQLRLYNVVATEGKCCGYFIPADGQTSATICETCGQEKHFHPQH